MTKQRTLKDPEATQFNPLHVEKSPDDFKAFFEANYSGDWKKHYKKLGGKVPTKAKKPKTESTDG